jgi:hypothetical protein
LLLLLLYVWAREAERVDVVEEMEVSESVRRRRWWVLLLVAGVAVVVVEAVRYGVRVVPAVVGRCVALALPWRFVALAGLRCMGAEMGRCAFRSPAGVFVRLLVV